MAGTIKGITIQFNGDTSKLDSALRQINKNTSNVNKELKQVDKALKFNPTSVELWRQKQDLLKQKITETRDKLDVLKQAQAKMDAEGVDKNSEEYRKLQREIIVAENQVKTFEGQLKKVGNVKMRALSEEFKQVGSKLESAGQAMKGVSMAAAAVVGSLGAISYKAGRSADDLNTLSKVTGIGTDQLQKYSYAADLVDVSVETIAKSNKKLTKSAYDAANGSDKQAAAFEQIGVSVVDANGNLRDSDAIFQDVITGLGQMTNETERDALAQTLMGKSAAELNPLIEDQGETYKRVSDTLKKYDLDFIDEESLNKANEFNDQLDTIKLIGSVAFAQLGTTLASTLAPALEKVVNWVGQLANWLSTLDPAVLTTVGAIAAVLAVAAPLLIGLGKIAFAISSIMSLMSTIGPAIAAISGPIGIVIGVIAAVIAAFVLWRKHGDKIKAFFAKLGDKLVEVWTKVKEGISSALEAIKGVFEKVFNAIKTVVLAVVNFFVQRSIAQFKMMKTVVTTVLNAIKSVFTTIFNAIKTVVMAVVNFIVQRSVAQFNMMKTTITTVVNAIKTVVTTVFNAIKTAITTIVNGIKTTVTTGFNAIKSTASSIWNGIKTAITAPINAAKNAVSNTVNAIKSVFNGFSKIAGSVRSAFNSVKDAITKPIQTAVNLIRTAIGKIKSIINGAKLKLPKFKLPHFIIKGGKLPWGIGGKGTAPTIDVKWYAKGGIFNSPTLAGIGEAGPEAVVPLDKFWQKLDRIAETSTGGGDIIININGANRDPREIAEEVKRVLIQETNRRRLAWQ